MGKDIIAFVFVMLLVTTLMYGRGNVHAQSSIAWHTSYQEGMQLAKTQNKPTIIFFESERCPWCEKQKEAFADTV